MFGLNYHHHRSVGIGLSALLIAVFAAGIAILALSGDQTEATGPPPTYTLYVYEIGDGTITPGEGPYSPGTVVDISAVAGPGYKFSHWQAGLRGTANPTTITMDSDKNVIAWFIDESYHTLCTAVSPQGAGSASPECESAPPGTEIQVEADANFGYLFSYWIGSPPFVSLDNPAMVVMDSDRTVTAYFREGATLRTYKVGSGIVTPYSGTYEFGAYVAVFASPSINWRFHHWSDGASGSVNPVHITMDTHKTVTAHFVPTWNLSTTIVGQGSVDPPAGAYDVGSEVSLVANPAPGWRFVEWSGDATGSTSPVVVTMDSHKAVTATFERIWYSLTAECVPQEAGHITPPGQPYPSGVTLALTAVPHAGWCFKEWQGDLTGTANPQNLTMDSAKSVSAVFDELQTLTYAVQGGGTVTIEPTPTETGPGWASFPPNTTVQLTATAQQDSFFDYWEGNIDPGGDPHGSSVTITMTRDWSTTAHFLARPGLSEIDMLGDLAVFLTEIGTVET